MMAALVVSGVADYLPSNQSTLSLISLLTFIVCFAVGFGPIPWLMTSEVNGERQRVTDRWRDRQTEIDRRRERRTDRQRMRGTQSDTLQLRFLHLRFSPTTAEELHLQSLQILTGFVASSLPKLSRSVATFVEALTSCS